MLLAYRKLGLLDYFWVASLLATVFLVSINIRGCMQGVLDLKLLNVNSINYNKIFNFTMLHVNICEMF